MKAIAAVVLASLLALVGAEDPEPFIITVDPSSVKDLGRPPHAFLNSALAQCGAPPGAIRRQFQRVINGVSASLTLSQKLCLDRYVNLEIVPDGKVSASACWGWERTLDGSAVRVPDLGSGQCTVYVLDTGVDCDNPLFPDGRCVTGPDFTGSKGADKHGHGTHCAGTVAAQEVGGSTCTVIGVKVLDDEGNGSWSDVISAIDWATEDCPTRTAGGPGCVVSISLGAVGYLLPVCQAIAGAAETKLLSVVAAGNDGIEAAGYTPAACAEAVTVGATTEEDACASFSNYGPCVDIWAPGVRINSTKSLDLKGKQTSLTMELTGTSMAAPHVAAIAGNIMALNPGFTLAQVRATLYSQGRAGSLSGCRANGGDRDLFAQQYDPSQASDDTSGFTLDHTCPPPPPPPACSPAGTYCHPDSADPARLPQSCCSGSCSGYNRNFYGTCD